MPFKVPPSRYEAEPAQQNRTGFYVWTPPLYIYQVESSALISSAVVPTLHCMMMIISVQNGSLSKKGMKEGKIMNEKEKIERQSYR